MNNTITVRPIRKQDAAEWERMRLALWPSTPGEHAHEIAMFFDERSECKLDRAQQVREGDRSDPAEVLIAWDDSGCPVGFAEMSIRPYAEGCYSGRVAYLEGWFVDESYRGRGIGSALVAAVEEWGRTQGCTELGSDTTIDNDSSAAAHRAIGFEEVDRIICFRKPL